MAKIIVIDDRVTNRNILTRLAASVEEGLQIQSYASPTDAMSRLRSDPAPDLIITDFNMPEMDGATFIETLRELPGFSEIPIIVVTVYEDREFCYRALEAGATDFLLSPVDHLEFKARAKNLLTLRKQQKMLANRANELEMALQDREASGNQFYPTGKIRINDLPVAIQAVDRQNRIRFTNEIHNRLSGISDIDPVGKFASEVYGDEYAIRHEVLNEKVQESRQPLAEPFHEKLKLRSGDKDVLTLKSPILLEETGDYGTLSVSIDATSLIRSNQVEKAKLTNDELTGLPNNASFRSWVDLELVRAKRHNKMLAIIVIDLDRFKGINDAFGTSFANRLLKEVASRLRAKLRENESLARLRSDEFGVLHTATTKPDDTAELCHRLNEVFSKAFLIESEEVHLSCSMGITLFPADGRNFQTLLKNADLAMYRAKNGGRDTYRFFAAEMNIAARKAVTLERELRQALAGEQFIVYYQPQMDLNKGKVIGCEALVRWNHPHRGIVRPGEFITLAEDIGLIAPLTTWVIRNACEQHRLWSDQGLPDLSLSVNLSPIQFHERGIELLIERILRETGVAPSKLDIELTENAVIENSQTAIASLRYLHQLGASISIDDFGTGYSSLSYLKRLPAQRLKIDQSFVQAIDSAVSDEVIVRAIINLGHSLGLSVIAEGVETPEQIFRLMRLGCNQIQGDLISCPIDGVEFQKKLANKEFERALSTIKKNGQ